KWRWLALGLLCLGTSAWAQQAKLEAVRVSTNTDRTRVVFDLSAAVDPDVFLLQSPARLVVDLPDTRKAVPHDSQWPGKGIVKQLRTGVRHGYDLRVVLDLQTAKVRRTSFTLPAKDGHGNRVVVDLYRREQPLTLADVVRDADTGKTTAPAHDKAPGQKARAAQLAAEIASITGADAVTDGTDTDTGKDAAGTAADAADDQAKTQRVAYTPTPPTRK